MNNPLDEFGIVLRRKRRERGFTQKQLAEYMGMSQRTILQAETRKSSPKFETVALLAKELGISLDAVIYPDTASPNVVPKSVFDFFNGMAEEDAEKYIAICTEIAKLTKK